MHGPMTKEEQADLETWRRYRQVFVDANEGLAILLAEDDARNGLPRRSEEQIRGNQQCIDLIDRMLQDRTAAAVAGLVGRAPPSGLIPTFGTLGFGRR